MFVYRCALFGKNNRELQIIHKTLIYFMDMTTGNKLLKPSHVENLRMTDVHGG